MYLVNALSVVCFIITAAVSLLVAKAIGQETSLAASTDLLLDLSDDESLPQESSTAQTRAQHSREPSGSQLSFEQDAKVRLQLDNQWLELKVA